MHRHLNLSLLVCLMLISVTLPARATTTCAYNFAAGNGVSYLKYCVTVNGNIPEIDTPNQYLVHMIGADGEGYGICDQNIQPGGINYTDYGVSDTGNWNAPTLISLTTGSVKIARTTSDGNWTLTQTITKGSKPPSINVTMALTNNQAVSDVAYLVRFAHAAMVNSGGYLFGNGFLATQNSVLDWGIGVTPSNGLLLENVGTPPFGFWLPYAQRVSTGPNACAFAINDSGGYWWQQTGGGPGSMEIAYVGSLASHQTKTVTLTYRPF